MTTVVFIVAVLGSDPGLESHDDREKFIQEVTDVSDLVPWIGIALGLQAFLAVLAAVVGVGL